MEAYIATFHTHLSALRSSRALSARGVCARMSPVPRKLSSSCGTCVRYQAESPCLEDMDADVDAVFLLTGDEEYAPVYRSPAR